MKVETLAQLDTVTIQNNITEGGNGAAGVGGGGFISGGDINLSNSMIGGPDAADGNQIVQGLGENGGTYPAGGGLTLLVFGSTATITDTVFQNNRINADQGGGGGLSVHGLNMTMTGGAVIQNQITGDYVYGGGIEIAPSSATGNIHMQGVNISGNTLIGTTSVEGGAIHILPSIAVSTDDTNAPITNAEEGPLSITQSCITGNSDIAVANDSGVTFDATNNWWGDPSGPSGVGPGTGDSVGPNVDYDPWLTNSRLACDNLLPNMSYETGTTIPVGWKLVDAGPSTTSWTCNPIDAFTGNCALHLTGTTNHYAAFYTNLPGGEAGESFELSAMIRGENVFAGPAALGVEVLRTNGTKRKYWINVPRGGDFDWQLFMKQFTTVLPYERIRVGVFFRPQGGALWVDDIALVRLP